MRMSYTRANIGDLPIDYSTLVTPADVAAHLGDADWRAIDCRHDLADPAAGERRYREEHLPGAQFAHLDRDLSGPRTATSGRHPLPDAEAFAAACSRWGIDADVQVVAYDDAGGAYAARLWWLLRAYGHRRVAVLDGGLAAWRRAGLPLETSIVTPPPRTFGARAFAGRTVDVAAVARIALDPATLLLDARAAERYAGSVEPVDPVAGHVPGAINRPFQQNLGADGRFLPAAELERQFTALLADRPAERLVSMCGSGVTACHTLLALEVAGLRGAVLYPGSWSEWCRQPDRPVATGATP